MARSSRPSSPWPADPFAGFGVHRMSCRRCPLPRGCAAARSSQNPGPRSPRFPVGTARRLRHRSDRATRQSLSDQRRQKARRHALLTHDGHRRGTRGGLLRPATQHRSGRPPTRGATMKTWTTISRPTPATRCAGFASSARTADGCAKTPPWITAQTAAPLSTRPATASSRSIAERAFRIRRRPVTSLTLLCSHVDAPRRDGAVRLTRRARAEQAVKATSAHARRARQRSHQLSVFRPVSIS